MIESNKNLLWREIGQALLKGVGVGLILGATFAAGFLTNRHLNRKPQADTSFALLQEADAILQEDYLGELPSDAERIHRATAGLVSSLDDPYTFFVEPQQAEIDESNLAGHFGGIGVELSRNAQGQYVIATVYRNNPAYEAGIREGDIILSVDDESMDTTAENMSQILAAIRGEVGDPVLLTLQRNDEVIEKEIVRAQVLIPSTFWEMIDQTRRIGYIEIRRFTQRTPEEIQQALRELKALGAEAYIIDLRDNGGGLVDSAVNVADEFIQGGDILYEERSDGSDRIFGAKRGGQAVEAPLALLINNGTASASEIVAGALHDHRRATLIGQQTYGKGSVQVIRELSDGSSIHVTTAQWYTPNRTRIEGQGLTPSITIESSSDDDAYMSAAVAYLQEQLASLPTQ